MVLGWQFTFLNRGGGELLSVWRKFHGAVCIGIADAVVPANVAIRVCLLLNRSGCRIMGRRFIKCGVGNMGMHRGSHF
jgi:hypothetical protein